MGRGFSDSSFGWAAFLPGSLKNVPIGTPSNYIGDRGSACAEKCSDFTARYSARVEGSNVSSLLRGEHLAARYSWPIFSSFARTVGHVSKLRRNKQMSRVITFTVVAFVANILFGCKFANIHLSSEGMGCMVSISASELPVSIRRNRKWPLQARIVIVPLYRFDKIRESFASLVSHLCALHGAWCLACPLFT